MATAEKLMRGLRGERERPTATNPEPISDAVQEVLNAFPWQSLAQNLATREDIDAEELSGILEGTSGNRVGGDNE